MGAFFVVNERDPERASALKARLMASMQAQGFAAPECFGCEGVQVVVYPKQVTSGNGSMPVQIHRAGDGRVAALTGTAIVHGQAGPAAAAASLARYQGDEPDWQRWLGQFCALLLHGDRLDLFLDPIGIYKVYRRADGRVLSSSFLAVASTLPAPRANSQGVYEYLAQEATYGRDTVLDEVCLARSGGVYRLNGEERFVAWSRRVGLLNDPRTLDEHVRSNLTRLRGIFDDLVTAFGDEMDTALSGGYDSRLILALLRERSVNARVHVYGTPSSPDVVVARGIADAEGFELDHEDKSRVAPTPAEEFEDVVRQNYHAFDGYPCAGIFEGGVDLSTRRERASDGRLTLNGGGGEVFRNFFYLPDRRFSARAVVHSFYNRFDPAVYTPRFDEQAYVRALEEKILCAIDATEQPLSRTQVERIYPQFRCRFWMGRNNAINNRLGFAITPFVDPLLLPLAAAVPIRLKNHGRLEATMIQSVSPSLARHLSDYGHAFDGPPPLKRILRDHETMLRPPWLRRLTYRIRNRRPGDRGRYLQPSYLRQAIDPALPLLSHFMHPARCHDPGMFQRACTLEYLFQQLQVDVD